MLHAQRRLLDVRHQRWKDSHPQVRSPSGERSRKAQQVALRQAPQLLVPQVRHQEDFLLRQVPLHGVAGCQRSAGDLERRVVDATLLSAEGELAAVQTPRMASVRRGGARVRQVVVPSALFDQRRGEASCGVLHELEGQHGNHQHCVQPSHSAAGCLFLH